ncbi:MAG: DUF6431 domain-containing protein [Promethearchaeota archaeon]
MLIVQTTLHKFFDSVPDLVSRNRTKTCRRDCTSPTWNETYDTLLHPDGTVEVAEKHCKCCGAGLIYNGYNDRVPVLDNGKGKKKFRVHRKRCPTCGEVSPTLNEFITPGSHYHENYKRRARQHFMNGMNPRQICEAMEIDFQIKFPSTTIRSWIVEMRIPLRKLMSSTQLPTSGHWQHDETYLSIRGKEHYALVTMDAETGFALAVTDSPRNTKNSTIAHFRAIKRGTRMKIKSITADGTIKFGSMFRLRLFKHAIRTQCLMHFKWRVGRKVKRLAGLGESSRKKLPRAYWTLRWLFYRVLDSHDETHAYIALERLRPSIEKANKPYLTRLFNDIEGKLPAIISWQRKPSIPTTNNRVENFHQQLQRHSSFEGRCRTEFAAQFIMDIRTFKFNFQRYKAYISKLDTMKSTFEQYKQEEPRDPGLSGGHAWFYFEKRRVMKGYGKYVEFWGKYMEIE